MKNKIINTITKKELLERLDKYSNETIILVSGTILIEEDGNSIIITNEKQM